MYSYGRCSVGFLAAAATAAASRNGESERDDPANNSAQQQGEFVTPSSEDTGARSDARIQLTRQ